MKGFPYNLAPKDTDARWTKKNDETHYGDKDHVKVDADSTYVGKKFQAMWKPVSAKKDIAIIL